MDIVVEEGGAEDVVQLLERLYARYVGSRTHLKGGSHVKDRGGHASGRPPTNAVCECRSRQRVSLDSKTHVHTARRCLQKWSVS